EIRAPAATRRPGPTGSERLMPRSIDHPEGNAGLEKILCDFWSSSTTSAHGESAASRPPLSSAARRARRVTELLMLYLRRSRISLLAPLAFLLALGLAASASAATITAPISSTFGPSLTGSVTVDDAIDPGNLVITAQIDAGRGSIRGLLA